MSSRVNDATSRAIFCGLLDWTELISKMTWENPFFCGREAMRLTTGDNVLRTIHSYPLPPNLEQLLRRQLGPFVIRVVDAAGRRERASRRI